MRVRKRRLFFEFERLFDVENTNMTDSEDLRSDVHPFWRTGFRSFFWIGSAVGALWMVLWVLSLSGRLALHGSFGMMTWHSHEMIFGFSTAIIAGFLLTAVQNWTGRRTARGKGLVVLCFLWLLGRIAVLLSGYIPIWIVMCVDVSFLPAVAWTIGVPLWKARSWRNLGFIPLLGVMTLGHLVIYLELLGFWRGWASKSIILGLHLVLIVVLVVGGRIIPLFTRNWIKKRGTPIEIPVGKPVGRFAIALLFAMACLQYLGADGRLWGAAAMLGGLVLLVRSFFWKFHAILDTPLLWVLHLGFIILCGGWIWEGWVGIRLGVHSTAALHTMAVGGLSLLILGMVARVSLGHTGRAMEAHPLMTIAFLMILVSAIMRVVPAVWFPQHYMTGLLVAGILWSGAFILFVLVFTPILFRARADGKPE